MTIRAEDERRLHDLAARTRTISKQLVDEMALRRKDLSRVMTDTAKLDVDSNIDVVRLLE